MTTPINSFQDILNAMDRDPALRDALRRYILTEEILALPAQVQALTDAVEALVIESRELRAGQEKLRSEVTELRVDVGELRNNVGRMGGDISRIMGTDYEGTAARIADRLVRRNLGLVDPTVVMRGRGTNATPPIPEVDEAAKNGHITWDESDELSLADVVVSATGQDGEQCYVLAEISITVQERDRVRAHRRAELLEKATGVTTIPVVIGVDDESSGGSTDVAYFQFDPDA